MNYLIYNIAKQRNENIKYKTKFTREPLVKLLNYCLECVQTMFKASLLYATHFKLPFLLSKKSGTSVKLNSCWKQDTAHL